jgi:hypothetical protein
MSRTKSERARSEGSSASTSIAWFTLPSFILPRQARWRGSEVKRSQLNKTGGGLRIFFRQLPTLEQGANEADRDLKGRAGCGGAQEPWVSFSPIKGDFYFSGAPAGVAGPPAADQAERA